MTGAMRVACVMVALLLASLALTFERERHTPKPSADEALRAKAATQEAEIESLKCVVRKREEDLEHLTALLAARDADDRKSLEPFMESFRRIQKAEEALWQARFAAQQATIDELKAKLEAKCSTAP